MAPRDKHSGGGACPDEPRIRVLRNERPVGVAAARNMGVQAANGSWIALLDDDDLWSPEKLCCNRRLTDGNRQQWV